MPHQEREPAEVVWKYIKERKNAGDPDAVNLAPRTPAVTTESAALVPLADALQEMFEEDRRAAYHGSAKARIHLIEAIQHERARSEARKQENTRRRRPWFLARPAFAPLAAGMALAAGLGFILLWSRSTTTQVQTASAPGSAEQRVSGTPDSRHAATKPSNRDLPKRTAQAAMLQKDSDGAFRGTPDPSAQVSVGKWSGRAVIPTGPAAQNDLLRPASASVRPADRVQDDLAYINADADFPGWWARMSPDQAAALEARVRRDVRVKDDFVAIPFPQVAAKDRRVVAEAITAYRREAAVVDARLARQVSLQSKGISLEDLCAALQTQIGVRLRAARGVRDEKATVLVKDQPARDVMRAVSRLFGFKWERSGEEGDYRYLLNQDLRAQLAEEELRNRDVNEALVAMDNEMKSLGEGSLDELKARWEQATGAERDRLHSLTLGGGWGAAQLYQALSPAERAALKSGQELQFLANSDQPDRRLPEEVWQSLLRSWGLAGVDERDGRPSFNTAGPGVGGGPGSTPVAQYLGIIPSVKLKMDRSELGVFSLEAEVRMILPRKLPDGSLGPSMGHTSRLAVVRSPSVARPDNAKTNHALRGQPLFQRQVSFKPEPSCPKQVQAEVRGRGKDGHEEPTRRVDHADILESPHVTSADVWEAVHLKTGLPVVADYYTRLHSVAAIMVARAPLFDALCRVGDALGVQWRQDGGFLLCRSTSFFWDKLKEVPNRYLVEWQQERTRRGGLPLEAVLQMASLSDQQLDSAVVGQGISHCWDLPEWGIVGNAPKPLEGTDTAASGTPEELRAYARFLAGLPPGTRNLALRPDGLPFDALNAAQQQEFAQIYVARGGGNPQMLPGLRIHADYVPAGSYAWYPVVEEEAKQRYTVYTQILKLPVVADKTAEGALARARRIYPKAAADQIKRSRGILAFTFRPDTDTYRIRTVGKPLPPMSGR